MLFPGPLLLLLLEQLIETRPLDRGQDVQELLSGRNQLILDIQLNGFVNLLNLFLVVFEDFVDALALFGGQVQFAVGAPEEIHANDARGAGLAGANRPGGPLGTARSILLGEAHQQAAGHHAGDKDDQRGQNDFPGVHQVESVAG